MIYGAGCLLVGLRFAWHMAFRLDRYDWHYGSVWGEFWLSVLLWPLFLMKPLHLLHPHFDTTVMGFDQAENARERDRLRTNPPLFGALLLYRPSQSALGLGVGEFVFRATDVEKALEKRLIESPHLASGDEGAMLNCVRQRDDSLLTPTEFPNLWSGLDEIAMVLMQSEHTRVKCHLCDQQYAGSSITEQVVGAVGRTYHLWVCPCQHNLLAVETARFQFKRT